MGASNPIPVTFLKKWGRNERGSFGQFAGGCKETVDGMVKAGFVLLGHKDLLTVGKDIPTVIASDPAAAPAAAPAVPVVPPPMDGPATRRPGRPRKV